MFPNISKGRYTYISFGYINNKILEIDVSDFIAFDNKHFLFFIFQ